MQNIDIFCILRYDISYNIVMWISEKNNYGENIFWKGVTHMDKLIYIIPAISVLGLLFALVLAMSVKKQEPGTERMKEIAEA